MILGGGFGGFYSALHFDKTIAADPAVEVTLVGRENFVLFTPMLHEVAAGDMDPSDIVSPLRQMLKRVRFLEADVEGIDLEARQISLAYGVHGERRVLTYDHLVIALGSESNFFTRVIAFSDRGVELSNGETLATQTLVWTAGVTPPRVLQSLPVKNEKGRIVVNEMLQVPGFAGVWAIGDCAWMPDGNSGKPHPPTAQHALGEAVRCAKNIVSAMRGSQQAPFRFTTLGQLATIGQHAGVADILGLRLSGFLAWWLWRTIYLAKLPTFEKKLRVALRWTLDFAFPRDLTQHVTLHGIDRVSQLLAYVRQHPVIPQPTASATSSALQSSS